MLTPFLTPIAVYGLFLSIVWQTPHPHRWELFAHNIETPLRTVDTIYSVFISFGFIWMVFLLMLVWSAARRLNGFTREERFLVLGGLISVLVTVPVGLSWTLAHETRVFFPPFVFLVPLAVKWLQEVDRRIVQLWPIPALLMLIIACEGLLWPGLKLGNYLFAEFEYRDCRALSRVLGGVHFGLSMAMILLGAVMVATGAITWISRRRRTPDTAIH
ncbi:MAG: hypothetical protein AB1644_07070 [Candidatus Zixiibacteriota bacterium]